MLGAGGAMACLIAGTAVGAYLSQRRQARWTLLSAQADVLGGMRLLLNQERMGMADLLRACAAYAPPGECGAQLRKRYALCAQTLMQEPLLGVPGAYERALALTPIPGEGMEERAALSALFDQLDMGTASMREQAVVSCLHRLKPLTERAQQRAQTGNGLFVRLGMLLGLMAGIALW